MEFSKRLKSIRKEKKLTQNNIAKILGISNSCYAGYEQGYREPDLNTLRKIAIIFDVTTDYLLGLEDESGAKIENLNQINNSFNNFNNNNGNFTIK